MKITAFICCYNEADIIGWTISHLLRQGVDVYIVDNWSTDNTAAVARAFPLVGFERFPKDGPCAYYSWRPLLARVETLAAGSCADWCIHHDADEIRRSPRRGESLAEAIENSDSLGYTAIDHRLFQFEMTDDCYQITENPELYFTHYSQSGVDSKLPHIKAWKNSCRVDLVSSGGHEAKFAGRRVSPFKLILKHYPLRTPEQAARKVLRERMARYDPEERAMQWHVQYDELARTQYWVKRKEGLIRWV